MNPDVVKNIALQSLNGLSDSRVMIPADSNDAIASLKDILRNLATGAYVLTPVRQEPPSDGDDSDE